MAQKTCRNPASRRATAPKCASSAALVACMSTPTRRSAAACRAGRAAQSSCHPDTEGGCRPAQHGRIIGMLILV